VLDDGAMGFTDDWRADEPPIGDAFDILVLGQVTEER
jgi:hypothetical protein